MLACSSEIHVIGVHSWLLNSPPQNGNRGFRQRIYLVTSAAHHRLHLRSIGIGVTLGAVWPPDVFIRAEGNAVHRTGKVSVVALVVREPHVYPVRPLRIFVH